MLQSSCLPFVLYASQRIACYFCTMKRFLLITIAAIFCSSATVCAQFNTVTQTKVHRKAVPKTTQSATSEQLPPCSPHQRRDSLAFAPLQTQTEQTDRHTALVSPLRHISVTSPFGYRRDPFTKRKALHNGLDLKANYEPHIRHDARRGHQGRQGQTFRPLCHPPSRRLHRQLLPPLPNSRHQRHPRPSRHHHRADRQQWSQYWSPPAPHTQRHKKRTSHRPVHSSQSYQASTLIERLVFCRSHHPFRIAIMS